MIVLDDVSILPPNNTGKIFTLKVWLFLHPVEPIFNVNVNPNVPVWPLGIITKIGDVPKFASVMPLKPDIVEVKLYLSGLPKVELYGKIKLVAELHKSATLPSVKSMLGATVTTMASLFLLVQPLKWQTAV